MDLATVELRAGGKTVNLEPQVFALLALLVENAERLVSKDEIIEKVWDGRVVTDAAVASRVKTARQALGDDGKPQQFIKTIHGRGYRFVAKARAWRTTNAAPPPAIDANRADPALWRILTAVVLLSATSWSGSVAADCLRYGIVNLTGRLVRQTYPGPPDYESVTKGDEPRVIWVLQLDRGICIAGSDSSYPSAYSEREIQLVLGTDQYARAHPYAQYRHLLGEKITVTGRLLPGGARYEKRFVVAPHEINKARLQP